MEFQNKKCCDHSSRLANERTIFHSYFITSKIGDQDGYKKTTYWNPHLRAELR